MVITAGPAGAILVGRDNITQIPTIEVPVVDVTGAGDTFIAALAVAIEDENVSLTQAVEFANLAAAVSVTKRGTSYVNRNEI
jgi:ribokinase